ncbi:MAG: WG repeat-containing protein [Oscillospiraceae bacterium]
MKKRLFAWGLTVALSLTLLVTPANALPKNVKIVNIPKALTYSIQPPSEGLCVFMLPEQGGYGYADVNGNIIIPQQYRLAFDFCEGLAVVVKDGKSGAIDKTGKAVIPITYDITGRRVVDGLLTACKDGKWGAVNKSNATVIPFIYDQLMTDGGENIFHDGLLYAKLGSKWGAINKDGNVVIPFLYSSFHGVEGNLVFATKKVVENGKTVERWGVINRAGGRVVDFIYEKVESGISENTIAIQKNGKWGYFDLNTGKELVTPKYKELGRYGGFVNGFAAVCNDKWGYINRAGVEVVPLEYDDVGKGFHDGCAVVAKRPNGGRDGGWGYIDTTGKPITEFNHITANTFSEGLATLCNGQDYYSGAFGAINTKGELVIPYTHDFTGEFHFGRAFFNKKGTGNSNTLLQGYIDKTGKVIVPPKYYRADHYTDYGTGDGDAYALVTYDYLEFGGWVNAKYYTIDRNGKQVKPYGFYSIDEFYDGIALAHTVHNAQPAIAWIYNLDYKAPARPSSQHNAVFPCTKSNILVNGKPFSFEGYNIVGNNYFKLRDLAMALNGTPGQFDVTWDAKKGAVNLIPGLPYTPVGGELAPGAGTGKSLAPSGAKTLLLGQPADLSPVTMGGNNFYMLRDLMEKLGVTVGWDGPTSTITLTTKTAEEAAKDAPVTGALTEGTYAIKAAKNKNIGFSVSGASTKAGGKITLYTTTDAPHYQFELKSVGDNQFTISPGNSDLMVTSPRKKGNGLSQQVADGSAAQTFTITYQEDGTYRITDCDGLFCAASEGKIANGTNVILWTRTEESGQTFVFERK